MIGLGTWACQWRELRPLRFGAAAAASAAAAGTGAGATDGTEMAAVMHKAKATPALPPSEDEWDAEAAATARDADGWTEVGDELDDEDGARGGAGSVRGGVLRMLGRGRRNTDGKGSYERVGVKGEGDGGG